MERASQSKSKDSSGSTPVQQSIFQQRPARLLTPDADQTESMIDFQARHAYVARSGFDLLSKLNLDRPATPNIQQQDDGEAQQEEPEIQRSASPTEMAPLFIPWQQPRTIERSPLPESRQRPGIDLTKLSLFSQPPVQRQTDEEIDDLQTKPNSSDVIQTKLTNTSGAAKLFGQPGDRYEQEADAMAAKVMTMPEPALQREEVEEELQTKPSVQREETSEDESVAQAEFVQRQEIPEEESAQIQPSAIQREAEVDEEEAEVDEEKDLQAKPLAAGTLQREMSEEEVQPKLVQRQEIPEEENAVQPESVQRQELPEEEDVPLQRKPIAAVQRAADSSGLESQLQGTKGSGSPLAEDTRSFMESRFSTDFSHVRVHTNSSAVQMNKDLSAQAFTHGSDVYFGAGKSPGQNDLTAHELTHVVQQTGARKPNKGVRLRLKKKKKPAADRRKKQRDRTLTSIVNKDSEKPSNPLQTESKAGLLPTSKSKPNKEVPTASLSSNASKPKAVDAAAKGGTDAKLELASEQTKAKADVAPSSQNAAQAPPSNLAAVKPEGATPDTKPVIREGAAIGGAAAPVPQADAAPAGGDVAGGSAEGEAERTRDDKELEAAATSTEGIELEAGDRADATASLAEVADSGGAPAEGGSGGGGGAAIADKPAPPVPDVSGADPAQAIAVIGQLPPAQLQAGLGGVTAAVGSTVGKERTELAANPPQMERPTGSPMTKEGTGDRATPAGKTFPPVEKVPQGQAKPVPQPQPLPTLPPSPIQSVPQPGSDPQAIKASLDRLPTRDPSLNVTAGSPPPLALQGDADPQQAQAQKAKLEKSVADTHAQGQQELAQPMGEDEIYPHVPKETLKAEGGGGGGSAAKGGGAGGAVKGTEGDNAISVIAQQERGQEIQAAVSQAQSQMTAKRQEHTVQAAQEKDKSHKDISKLQSENETQQAQERSKAQTEVSKQKESWNKEQTALVKKSGKDSDVAVAKGMKDVQQEQTQAETKANQHIEKGNQDAETARKQGEEQATAEKQKSNQESGGIFGWLADKAKAFFDGIKQAIQKAFEFARAAVKLAIETAKKLATEVIKQHGRRSWL